ncbi:MAG: OmpA family protein [Sulfurovaceae bacterium]|nr:OmpA family protein [Sulfurovaceae bacterium]
MKMIIGKLLIPSILAIGISGCIPQKQVFEKKDLGFTAPGISDKETLVVFYRKGGDKIEAPTVWVGDRMVGTLMPNQYTQAWVCPARTNVHVDDSLNIGQEQSFVAPKGQVLYYEVYKPTNSDTFAIRKTEGMSANIISHSDTLNRYKPYCNSEYIELNADTLFAFNKATLSPEGVKTINDLATKIKNDYFSVKKVRIEGHTDRIGTNEYNDQLSSDRAKAVASQLKANNIGVLIDAIGIGERDPITRGCQGETPTPQLIECLAPDRRVSIEIIGVQNTVR